jgi:hypothetical protein
MEHPACAGSIGACAWRVSAPAERAWNASGGDCFQAINIAFLQMRTVAETCLDDLTDLRFAGGWAYDPDDSPQCASSSSNSAAIEYANIRTMLARRHGSSTEEKVSFSWSGPFEAEEGPSCAWRVTGAWDDHGVAIGRDLFEAGEGAMLSLRMSIEDRLGTMSLRFEDGDPYRGH